MSNYEVREKRLDPDAADYIQRWLDEYARQREPVILQPQAVRNDDDLNFWRGLCWAVPVGLAFWAGVAWLFS